MKSISVKQKLKHLVRVLKFKKSELIEIEKMYSCQFFDTENKGYQKLLEISSQLCKDYDRLDECSRQKQNIFGTIKLFFKRRKILKKLFIKNALVNGSRSGLKMVVGLVELDKFCFFNKSVHFSPYSITKCGKNVLFGVNVQVGNDNIERKDNKIKLSTISIKNDSWICAGVKIDNNVEICEESVVGAGAVVKNNVGSKSLYLGRPAKLYAKLDNNYISQKKIESNYSEFQRKIIFENLKKLGFKKVKEFGKALNGELINEFNIKLASLFLLTHRLCGEYNNKNTGLSRKKEIIDLLFPIHGKNFNVGKNIYLDLLGTTIIGDNVSIGNNVCLAGNLQFKDNVKVGNNVCMFASGHELLPECRKMRFSFKKGFYNYAKLDVIIVEKNINLSDNSVIVPSTIVRQDVPENALCTNSKIIM